MIIVDAHEDIAYNALSYQRDYTRAAAETRRLEADRDQRASGIATLGLPDALDAGVGLVFSTLFVAPHTGSDDPLYGALHYKTPQEAHKLASQQLDFYLRLLERDERLRLVTTAAELDAVLATWADFELPRAPLAAEPEDAQRQREAAQDIASERRRELAYARRYDPAVQPAAPHRLQGLVLLMENADPIREPAEFEAWYERGLRIVGPAWRATRYSGGWTQPGPLTHLGRELLDVLASFNAILDLSHMAEEAFLEAVERYEGVLIASHSNPRRFSNTDRHLSDTMIRLLAERDGVMGVVIYNPYLNHTWMEGDPKQDIPFSVISDIIDHICQLTGSAAHVGIGTDFDGGFGANSIPAGMDSIADLPKIADGLRARGYSEADINAVMSGNMLRKLRQSLPAG